MYNKICIHCRYAGLLVVPSHKSISPYIVPDLFDSFLSASCYIVCHVYVLNTHIHKNLDNFFFIYTEKFRPSQHPVDFKSIYFNLSFICNGFLGCSHQGNVLAGGKEWKHIKHLFLMVPMHHVVLTFQSRNACKTHEICLGLELTSDVNLDLHSWELSKKGT